jgi:hypothetical protein
MENIPVIQILGYNLPPEIEEKYNNWTNEVYLPNLVKLTPVNEVDRYRIVKKDPSYPDYFALWNFNNMESVYNLRGTPFFADLFKDMNITFNKVEFLWSAHYQPMRSFGNSQGSMNWREETTIENAPFIHLEAFRLTAETEAKYVEWSIRYANQIYIPLLMKVPGIKGYDRYRISGTKPPNAARIANYTNLESNYPSYLQVLYFENEKAFENYENSPELASVKRAMKSDISDNLVHQWYVQYQLIKSFRK